MLQRGRFAAASGNTAERLSLSLDVSGTHRSMSGASAIGAQCRQRAFSQLIHHQHEDCLSCASVGGVGVVRIR